MSEETAVTTTSTGTQARQLTLAKALNEALRRAMRRDERVLLLGEDIGKLGGVFRVTDGLQHEFGSARVLDTPLAEAGIVGNAIGLALAGYRPVVEIQFDGFIFPAMNQIVSQLAKITSRHEGTVRMPVVIRVPYGGHIGAVEHHQESPEAYFAHTPGLRVVAPATPDDAYWMLQQAIASDDPVLFFEPKSRYWQKAEVRLAVDEAADGAGAAAGVAPGAVESGAADAVGPATSAGQAPVAPLHLAPLHSARVVREGSDCTLVGYGAMVATLLQAAEIAEAEGTSLEVVDLRSISPIDYEPLLTSVRKTGRLVVAQEAPGNASVASEIAAHVAEHAFYSLTAPVLRVAGFDVPFPPAALEGVYLPDADRVLEAVDRTMRY